MKFITPVALLAMLQAAAASPVEKTSTSGLQVTLSQVDNTKVKAVVQNTGSEEVTFVHLNFFKDASPVKKVSLFRENNELEFQGIKYRVKTTDLSDDALTSLAPGATLEDVFDIASTSDLSEGGSITLRSEGVVPLVTENNVTGSLPFTSNELTITVDGAEAAKVANVAVLDKRTRIASCSGSRSTALQTALRNTVSLANAAASAARSGGSRFTTFFKSDSTSTRNTVAARFSAVASEASSTSSGSTTYYCTDAYGYCSSNVLAWTLPAYNIIANCELYYSYLPALTSSCYAQDQATTTLHEFTHAPGVYSPGTDDYAYGYSASVALSASQALLNADSYALFANAVNLGC
ncbi:Deuterolysin metalloprotease family-domain-containing protein [Aspergillus stella-maris]|uniref:Deuterolysin metalloprotease family-domain-containing protein n=1 Tax=Aspergillus stella-maris TaxID=1810926 RepID=UPI003CCD8DDB